MSNPEPHVIVVEATIQECPECQRLYTENLRLRSLLAQKEKRFRVFNKIFAHTRRDLDALKAAPRKGRA